MNEFLRYTTGLLLASFPCACTICENDFGKELGRFDKIIEPLETGIEVVILDNCDYAKINEILDARTKLLDGVNFIRYVGVDGNKKCSVVCQYCVREKNQAKEFYYGLHPKLSPAILLKEIKNGVLRNPESLLKLMNKYKEYFSLHEEQKYYEKAAFAKVLIRMASRFGILIRCDVEAAGVLTKHIQMRNDIFINNITYSVFENSDNIRENEIAFLGGITDAAAEYIDLSPYGIIFNKCEKRLFLVPKEYAGAHKFSELYKLLEDKDIVDTFKLCNGSVYYSGVLPRVYNLEKVNSYSNPEVQTLRLLVERTTFATLDAFDNCDIIKHPLLQQFISILNEFEQKEDEAQELLFSKENFQSNDSMLLAINRYLESSYNTHTVGVSGNIVTKDDFLIVAKRDKKSIDSNTYYCSVNGQSEFRDHNVSFYKECISEDYPSMLADPNFRNDFGQELNRETLAELNITALKRDWEYYGIAILGIKNTGYQPENLRRMHVNVLAYNSSQDNLHEIIEMRLGATEKFENQLIEGIRFKIYYSYSDKVKSLGIDILQFFQEYGSIINYTLGFLYLFITSINYKVEPGNRLEFAKSLSTYLLAFFALLYGVINLIKRLKLNKKVKPYMSKHSYTATNNVMKNAEEFSNKILNRKKGFHPILHLMSLLFLYQKFDKD